MKHTTNTKRLIQLLSITVFSSLLFVGVAGVTPAQAENLDGLVKSLAYCDDGLGDHVALKEKILDVASFDVDQSGAPTISATVTVDATVFLMSGNILAKNSNSGVFQLFGNDGASADLAMNGKYKLNGDGVLVRIAGELQAQDLSEICMSLGKFKAKNLGL